MPEARGSGTRPWWPSDNSVRLSDLLREVHDEQVGNDEFKKLCEEGFEALREACTKAISKPEFRVEPFDWTPDVVLEAFGSTRQGTALKTSDLDVRMTFEQFEVHRQERQTFYLKGVMATPDPRFKVLKIVQGRVPVLRMRFNDKLDVDLSMGGTFEGGDLAADTVGVDHYIKAVLAAAVDEESARSFVRLVKIFAKANGLVDTYLGYLSSTSWTLLAINFLQSQRCLPPASGIMAEDGDQKPCKRPRMVLWPVRLTVGLFSRFFAYMERCGEQPHKVSVFHGKHVPMHSNSSHPLFLEYPSERRQGTNVAMTLTEKNWRLTVKRCMRARLALTPKEHGSWESCEADAMVALGWFFACVGGEDGKGALPKESREHEKPLATDVDCVQAQ